MDVPPLPTAPFEGLVAAPHTPFDDAGELVLAPVEAQAERLLEDGVRAVYVAGATGEGLSLSVSERERLFERWVEVAAASPMRVIAHVGASSLREAVHLARKADELGVEAIASIAPPFHRPGTPEAWIEWLVPIAGAAPERPLYLYDIPELSGVSLDTARLLELARERIPNLRGVKYTRPELDLFQRCRTAGGGHFELLWGRDEALLAGLALGARGAVGSSYNFAAPLYHRLIRAFQTGDMEAARSAQRDSVALIDALAHFGYLAAAKETMRLLGVDVGAPRAPERPLLPLEKEALRIELERLGFFDRLRGHDSTPRP